jgi:hypothetical protein
LAIDPEFDWKAVEIVV